MDDRYQVLLKDYNDRWMTDTILWYSVELLTQLESNLALMIIRKKKGDTVLYKVDPHGEGQEGICDRWMTDTKYY
jgi:phosphoribosylaminoimidazole carboxylase (NCAIR synthetase)